MHTSNDRLKGTVQAGAEQYQDELGPTHSDRQMVTHIVIQLFHHSEQIKMNA